MKGIDYWLAYSQILLWLNKTFTTEHRQKTDTYWDKKKAKERKRRFLKRPTQKSFSQSLTAMIWPIQHCK